MFIINKNKEENVMSVRSEYFNGEAYDNNKTHELFDALQDGCRHGRDLVETMVENTSRRYGVNSCNNQNQEIQFFSSGGYRIPSNQTQQQQYHAPNPDMYGWGPGIGNQVNATQSTKYPGIYLDSYGSYTRTGGRR